MLNMEEVVGIIRKVPSSSQVDMLTQLAYGPKYDLTQQLRVSAAVDRFEAHSILAYVLSHTMSDEHNTQYVRKQLGLEA